MCSGSDYVYVKTGGKVAAINIFDRSVRMLAFGEEELGSSSCLYANGDSLIVSAGNVLYLMDGMTNEAAVLGELAGSSELISAICRTSSGLLLLGTEKAVLSLDGSFRIETPDQVLAIAEAPEEGRILIGLKNGGFCVADINTRRIVESYGACEGMPMINIRAFATSRDGSVYVGTASGLFLKDKSGRISEIALNGKISTPIYDVIRDRDGNIWTGTCYSGVLYANVSTYHFRSITPPPANGPVRGFAQDANGVIWAATDAFGMHRYIQGRWVMVDGSYGIKHQCIMYDRDADVIYAGEWSGNLLRYSTSGKIEKEGPFVPVPGSEVEQYIIAMDKCGNDLVFVTPEGVFLFDPQSENTISRKLEGILGKIRDVAVGQDGRIWFGGNGVAWYDGEKIEYVIEPGGSLYVQQMEFSPDGILWCATEIGLASIKDGSVHYYGGTGHRILSQSMNYILPFGDHVIAAGTKKGLVFMDRRDGSSKMYDQESGLSFKSTMSSGGLKLSDGSVWFGGIGGIEALDPEWMELPEDDYELRIDRLLANGQQVLYDGGGKSLVFDHSKTDISFDLADFDFSEIGSAEYVCKLEGLGKEWEAVDIREKAEYTNLRPGRYTFRVRAAGAGTDADDVISLPFRIKRVWYVSTLFIMMEILVVLLLLSLFIRNRYAKAVLTEKLKLQEEEYRKQTSFFINLSFKMRTPLNLIIGNLEQYFKDHGARARGVEDIQEIYGKAKGLRGIISEYVDTQNEAMEREPRHAKTINAVLGVVERNLFTKELNVTVLCDELNMGKTKLTEVMKEATGMTPGEYIEDVRLRHAAQMLQNGNYTVNEISDKLGFSSASYFSVRFKRKFGMAPSHFASGHKD